MKVVRVEDQAFLFGRGVRLRLVEELHDAGADGHRDAHDDALADAVDGVLLSVVRGVELKEKAVFLEKTIKCSVTTCWSNKEDQMFPKVAQIAATTLVTLSDVFKIALKVLLGLLF